MVLSTDAGLSADEALALAAGAEQRLSHPVAVAISDEALPSTRDTRAPEGQLALQGRDGGAGVGRWQARACRRNATLSRKRWPRP